MSAAFQNRFQTPHKPPAWGNVLALYATLGLLCMVHNILSLNIFNRALSDVEGPAILITWLALAVSSIYYKNYAQDWANCVVVGWLDIIGLKMTISIINSHAFSGCTAIALLHMAVLTPVMLHDNVPELQTKTRAILRAPITPNTFRKASPSPIGSPLSSAHSEWSAINVNNKPSMILPAPTAEEYELAKSSKVLDFDDEVSELEDHIASDRDTTDIQSSALRPNRSALSTVHYKFSTNNGKRSIILPAPSAEEYELARRSRVLDFDD